MTLTESCDASPGRAGDDFSWCVRHTDPLFSPCCVQSPTQLRTAGSLFTCNPAATKREGVTCLGEGKREAACANAVSSFRLRVGLASPPSPQNRKLLRQKPRLSAAALLHGDGVLWDLLSEGMVEEWDAMDPSPWGQYIMGSCGTGYQPWASVPHPS